jgi:16S rRNA G966 N2-methylase RsmD
MAATDLERISQARHELAEARSLQDVKAILDVAVAAKKYAEAKRLGEEAVGYAQEIINRAVRRMGEMLAADPAVGRGRPGMTRTSRVIPEGITYSQSSRAQQLARIPEPEFEAAVAKPQNRLLRIQRDRDAEQRRVTEARQDAANLPEQPRADLRLGDFRQVLAGVDAVITDPPYPREFLPLLGDLASWADKALTPDGILAVLFGQTYLPEVYRLLDGHRPYRWTMAYLTPGPAYASHSARVQSKWKPVLVYGGGPRFDDVLRSEGTDAGAKDLHKWGQDYSGFHTLVERLTRPGQTVADPFMGSGTTLLAAHALGRHVIGADIDAGHVATARERLG